MSVNNIYGPLKTGSEVVFSIGNCNTVFGLLQIYGDLLKFVDLHHVDNSKVVVGRLFYENDTDFFIAIGDLLYIGIYIDKLQNAVACVRNSKTLFYFDYSYLEDKIRPEIMSGIPYTLGTRIGNNNYVINWKVQGFSGSDVIKFIPLAWYSSMKNYSCFFDQGVDHLINNLKMSNFKGYTDEEWCSNYNHVTHCPLDVKCGNCLGQCSNRSDICRPFPESNGSIFYCDGSPLFLGVSSNDGDDIIQSSTNFYVVLSIITAFLIIILVYITCSRNI